MYHFLCVLASLSLTSQPTTSLPAGKVIAEVRFEDGSLVKMTMLQPDLEVMTKYGKLTIPFADIRRITFGRHVPEAVAQEIPKAIQLLGSTKHQERERAALELFEFGNAAYPAVKKATSHSDLEVALRATQVLKKLTNALSPDELNCSEEDCIETVKFRLIGRILEPSLKAHSKNFGELVLKLPNLRKMQFRTGQDTNEFMVDAAKYGSALDQWFDTGLTVDSQIRLVMKSDGQIDLWPQGPGQYMTGPKGYTVAGKGGSFMAGTLVGRISATGKAFVIGEQHDSTPTQEGKLFLHIVPSPWNNASAGNYRVMITTDFATTAR